MSSLNPERIVPLIQAAIEELNLQLPAGRRIPASSEASLAAPEGLLDSMGMVILIAGIEDRMREWTGADVVLSNEGDAAVLAQAFLNVRTLAEHVAKCASDVNAPPDRG